MRKLFAIAFTCVYLTLTVGVVHATHYCMGRVKSSSLFSFQSEKCACALMAASLSVEGCCEDEVDLLKIDDDQSASSTLSISPAFFTILEKVFTLPVEVKDDGNSGIFTSLVRPPGKHIPLFVQHCSLVFYDDSDLA